MTDSSEVRSITAYTALPPSEWPPGNHGVPASNHEVIRVLLDGNGEARAIHEHQPRAHVVGVFYLPLAATMDRTARSTFARLVAMLRARSGRIDFSLPTQLNRLDKGVIGLYVPATTKGGPKRGVVRYLDVESPPPASGRPRLATTMTLEEVIESIAETFREEAGEVLEYADPEED